MKKQRTYKLCHRVATRRGRNGELKTWQSKTYYISYYEERKKKWLDTGLEDEEAAKEFYNKKIPELECGTVYEFLRQHNWLDETNNPLYVDSNKGNISYHLNYAHSKKNVRYLKIILEEIKDPIRDCPFTDLTRKDVQAFKDRLADLETYTDGHGHKRTTTATFKNKTLAAFSTIWSYYLRTGKANVKTNPFLQIEKFKKTTPTKKKYIFTPEDYSYLFDRSVLETIVPISSYDTKHAGQKKPLTVEQWDDLINSIWIDFFEFVFLTGMRGSEAAAVCVNSFEPGYEYFVLNINRAFKSGLRKNDVNFNPRGIEIIGKTKTGESRTIVLCTRAREIAMKYMKGKSGDDLLFTLPMKGRQNPFSTYLLSHNRTIAFRLFMDEMNAQYDFTEKDDEALSLHGFRTSLNSILLEQTNLRESLIAYVMGWTSHSLTETQREHYTQYKVDDLIDVAREINRLYLDEEFSWKPITAKVRTISRQDRRAAIMKSSGKYRWINKLRKALVELRQKVLIGEYELDEDGEEYGGLIDKINTFLDLDLETMKNKNSDFYFPLLNQIGYFLTEMGFSYEEANNELLFFSNLRSEYESNDWDITEIISDEELMELWKQNRQNRKKKK